MGIVALKAFLSGLQNVRKKAFSARAPPGSRWGLATFSQTPYSQCLRAMC